MSSPATLHIIVILLAAFSAGSLLLAVLYPRIARSSTLDKRVELIGARNKSGRRNAAATDESGRKRSVEETLREMEEKHKAQAKKKSKPSLMNRIRQAGLGWSRKTYYFACVVAGVLSLLVALGVFRIGAIPALGFGMAGGLLLPHLYVNFKRGSRFKRFSAEFPNAVDVIVRGVRAGLPLTDCLKIIAAEAQEPVKGEFKTIVEDQTIGLPLDEAIGRLAERVPISEAKFFAIVIAIQSRTGGSLAEALGNLSKVLRDRKKMQSKIKSMSQEAKSSAGIIGALPFIVAFLVYLSSPDYIALLFTETAGNLVLAVCGFWMFLGIIVMRKMINFDF